MLIQGEAGIIATTGYPDAPAKVGVSMTDLTSSMYAAVGILLALYQREKTGRGPGDRHFHVRNRRSPGSAISRIIIGIAARSPSASACGTNTSRPTDPYLASDKKYVGVAVASASDWEIFCRQVIERPDLLDDAKFKTNEARRNNRDELESLIEKLFLEHPSAEWKRRLEQARLPYGSVNSIAEVLAHPQLLARNMIQEIDSPVGPVPVLASPLRLSDSPQRLDPIPALGEDTDSVLRDLGYSDAEIAPFAATA